MGLTEILGSISAAGVGGTALVAIVRRAVNWRIDQRHDVAVAEGVELDNMATLKSLWADEFTSMRERIEDLERKQRDELAAWTQERADLHHQLHDLEVSVDALRAQLVAAGLTPAA